ncbi:MAG: hypothetical protein ACOYXA_08365 [Bacteroidota bacterium]
MSGPVLLSIDPVWKTSGLLPWGFLDTLDSMKFLILVLLTCGLHNSAQAQLIGQIVERYLTASGGATEWSNIDSYQKDSKVWQNLDYINLTYNQKSSIVNKLPTELQEIALSPCFSITQLKTSDGAASIVYNNDVGSGILKSGLYFDLPAQSPIVISMPKKILSLYQEGKLKFEGEAKLLEEDCFILKGPYDPHSDVVLNFYFSKRTGLLIATENKNRAQTIQVLYLDYMNFHLSFILRLHRTSWQHSHSIIVSHVQE